MGSKPVLDAFHAAIWRKSSRSSPSGDNCVQVAFAGGGVGVRDSENPGPIQTYTREQWQAFIDAVKDGEFDLV